MCIVLPVVLFVAIVLAPAGVVYLVTRSISELD
jgi:hypothetical protein